jgi:YD repeat-containing protein
LSQSTTTSSTGGNPTITTYRWLNHDIVSETTGANTTSWSFYTDKPRKDGDYLWLLKINYGGDILRTANLLKSSGATNFSYEFDSDGKLSSMTFSDSGSSQTISYEYTCN